LNSIAEFLKDHGLLKEKEDFKEEMEIDTLRSYIDRLLLLHKKDEASELITKHLKQKNKFYAVRDDDRKEIWIYKDGIYVPNGATYIQEFCRLILNQLYTSHFSNRIIDKIRADSFINPEVFFRDSNKEEIAVENGILNIYTKDLKKFDDSKIFFQKIPINYDITKDCQKIKNFLKDIMEDEKDCQVIKELFGDLLHKEYKFERCFMWLGSGRNGKSKLGELMKRFVGSKSCCSIHPSAIEDPESFSISSFFGKLVNLSLDINSTALKNISMMKSLSGRDLISAPRKFKTPIEFENYAKLIYGANQLPITFDTKDSFWERWILLQFPNTFVSQERLDKIKDNKNGRFKLRDNDIMEKLTTEDEMSGLLNYALEGFSTLIKNGKFSYKYNPEEVRILWIMKSDSFSAFFMKYLEQDYNSKIKKNDLRKYYADFCRKNKLRHMSDKMIKRKMQDEGIVDDDTRFDGNYESFWSGVKIKSKFEQLDENKYSQLKDYESERTLEFIGKLTEEKQSELKLKELGYN
jgi:putative DNA primase/helicase